MWPISNPAPRLSDGQQRAQQSACANTRDEPATFTPGSLTCCSVGHSKTPSCLFCCRNYFHHTQPTCWILGLLVPVDDEHHSHLILGVLLTLRYLMPLLQQQVNTISLKGSFGVMQKEADVQPAPDQLLQVLSTLLRASRLPCVFFNLWLFVFGFQTSGVFDTSGLLCRFLKKPTEELPLIFTLKIHEQTIQYVLYILYRCMSWPFTIRSTGITMLSQQRWNSYSRYYGPHHRSFCTGSSLPAASNMLVCSDRTLRVVLVLAASLSSSVL